MSYIRYKTKDEVFNRGAESIGVLFKSIDATGRLKTGKGAVGTVIEESWFGYKVNNDARPDFEEAGVELKVTPYIRIKSGDIRAKERIVCNIIDYLREHELSFEESSFWQKCETLLIMAYEYKKELPKAEYTISGVLLFKFPEEDLFIVKQDWEKIIQKIKDGKAHEISEGDTIYLGACTKGATAASSLRRQPFSDKPAKQRAYSLKTSYVSYILKNYLFTTNPKAELRREVSKGFKWKKTLPDTKILKDISSLKEAGSFEQYLYQKIKPYIGKSQTELKIELDITSTAKNLNELLVAAMLGIQGKISDTEEFKKAGIIPKTIRVNFDGSIKESMSFPAFAPAELVKETWEDSHFKNYLESTKFLFIIFRYNQEGILIFDRILFWNIPQEDLKQVQAVWEKTVQVLKEGVKFEAKGTRTYNNLPKQKDNPVSHVRPHARNKNDTFVLPNGMKMPKQCFWLNNTYIAEQIKHGAS